MAEPPVCNKCGQPHWRFVRCADFDAERYAASQRRRNQPIRNWQVPEGFRVFGDRLESWERHGNILFRKER